MSVFGRFITVNSAVFYWILYITPDLPTRYRRYLGVLDSWRQPKLYDGLTLFHFYVKRIHLVLIFRWMKWKYNSKWRYHFKYRNLLAVLEPHSIRLLQHPVHKIKHHLVWQHIWYKAATKLIFTQKQKHTTHNIFH